MFSFADGLLIVATVSGPVLAVQVQKWVENWKQSKERRERIFKTLMATRAIRLGADHVGALNLIDIEFHDKSGQKKVRTAWKAYRTHLGEAVPEDKAREAVFSATREDLFTDLLYEMGVSLGYDFDKTEIKKSGYGTVYQSNVEADAEIIRKGLAAILSGKAAFPMSVVDFPADPEAAKLQIENFKLWNEVLRKNALTMQQPTIPKKEDQH